MSLDDLTFHNFMPFRWMRGAALAAAVYFTGPTIAEAKPKKAAATFVQGKKETSEGRDVFRFKGKLSKKVKKGKKRRRVKLGIGDISDIFDRWDASRGDKCGPGEVIPFKESKKRRGYLVTAECPPKEVAEVAPVPAPVIGPEPIVAPIAPPTPVVTSLVEGIPTAIPKDIATLVSQAYKTVDTNQVLADLNGKLEAYVTEMRSNGALPQTENVSLYVYHIDDNRILASHNIDAAMMSASLIKPFVMAAAYAHKKKKGVKGKKWKKVKKDIKKMIVDSDNKATNRVIKFVGGVEAVQAWIDSQDSINETKVTKTIPEKSGRIYTENLTSAHDLNILLNQIYRGNIVSPKASAQMLKYLDAAKHSRIQRGNISGVKDTTGKTGYVYGMNGESAIITYADADGKERHVIVTAMFEDRTRPLSTEENRLKASRAWSKSRSQMIRNVARLTLTSLEKKLTGDATLDPALGSKFCNMEPLYLGLALTEPDVHRALKGKPNSRKCFTVQQDHKPDFETALQAMWDYKVNKAASGNKAAQQARGIRLAAHKKDPRLTTLVNYVREVDGAANAMFGELDWEKVRGDYFPVRTKKRTEKQVKRDTKLSRHRARVLKKAMSKVGGEELVAYGMTELMPARNGTRNVKLLDYILQTGGAEFIDSIPALYDDYSSLGLWQFTSHAVNGVTGAGATRMNKHVKDSSKRIPSSVNKLQGDDHAKAAYLFAAHNFAILINQLRGKRLAALEAYFDGLKGDDDHVQYMATAHHNPGRARTAARKWLVGGTKKDFAHHCRGTRIHGYALKTKANLGAL